MHEWKFVCVCVCVRVYVCVCVCAHTHMCMCACVSTYKERAIHLLGKIHVLCWSLMPLKYKQTKN